MGQKLKSQPHLDRDPNDPRLNTPATPNLSKLNEEDPEKPAADVEVTETKRERTVVPNPPQPDPNRMPVWGKEETTEDSTRVGTDPNDARLVDPVEDVSLPEGEDASVNGSHVDVKVDINNPDHGNKTFEELRDETSK